MLNKLNRKQDNYDTPLEAWKEILEYIPKNRAIWDPFFNSGNSQKFLAKLGVDIIHTEEDFFSVDYGDIILTNPPFSKKKSIFIELRKREKPFIMLVPLDTLCTKYFSSFVDEVTILIPKKRIQFIEGGKNIFNCVWVLWKIEENPRIKKL